jgi:hypothetical protein
LRTPHRRRLYAAAFAVFALLLQSLAPLAILPPRGQAVHFAHAHYGGHGEHQNAPRPETPSCPVCQALQAGGSSTAAPAFVLAAADFDDAALPLPRAIEAPAAPALPRARARAPPLNA